MPQVSLATPNAKNGATTSTEKNKMNTPNNNNNNSEFLRINIICPEA